jgi:serine/threonine protein kinase/WD40 repeat protein
MTVEQDPLIGTMLGKYLLVGRLGQGGMGVVYQGEDSHLQRAVAVKVLSTSSTLDGSAIQRFVLEARAAARLNHPNVVAVYDIGRQDNVSYIVMELVQGSSAQDLLQERGALPWPEATRIITEVCQGLVAAHAAGLIHRDIKPGNILLGRGGSVKLTDFGLAKAPQLVPAHTTHKGTVLGTPHYMSPEQCAGDVIDARTDVYALGAAYYALLTGRPPYDSLDCIQAMFAHCTAPVPDPRSIVPELPEACAAIVMRAMAKERANRFRSTQEMLTALTAVRAQLAANLPPVLVPVPEPALIAEQTAVIRYTPAQPAQAPVLPPRPRRFAAAAAVAAMTAIVLTVVYFAFLRHPAPATDPHRTPINPAKSNNPPPFPAGRPVTLTQRQLWGKHTGEATGLAFGGRRFATIGTDKIVRVWDLDNPKAPPQRFEHRHELNCVALSHDGKWLATGNLNATIVSLWDVDTGKPLGDVADAHGPWSLVFHPSDNRLAIGGGDSVQVIDLDSNGKEIKRQRLEGGIWVVTGVAFTPDGKYLGAITYEPGAYFLDAATLKKIAFIPSQTYLLAGPSFSADGKQMSFVKKFESRQELYLWEPQTDKQPQFVTREIGGGVICATTFAPGGRQLAFAGTFGGPVKLHDMVSGQSSSFSTDVNGNVLAMAFSPDGRLLGATCSDGSVLGWEVVPVER